MYPGNYGLNCKSGSPNRDFENVGDGGGVNTLPSRICPTVTAVNGDQAGPIYEGWDKNFRAKLQTRLVNKTFLTLFTCQDQKRPVDTYTGLLVD